MDRKQWIASMALALAVSLPALAQTAPGNELPGHRGHRHGFGMGLCVGQTLAQQSPPVILTPGQAPTVEQKSAIKTARATCKAQIKSNRSSAGSST